MKSLTSRVSRSVRLPTCRKSQSHQREVHHLSRPICHVHMFLDFCSDAGHHPRIELPLGQGPYTQQKAGFPALQLWAEAEIWEPRREEVLLHGWVPGHSNLRAGGSRLAEQLRQLFASGTLIVRIYTRQVQTSRKITCKCVKISARGYAWACCIDFFM